MLLHDLAKTAKPPTWIVENILPAGSLVFFAGSPKIAQKTFTAIHLGMCVSSGIPFVGYKTVAMPVEYLFMEDGPSRVGYRAKILGINEIDPPPRFVCRFEHKELAEIVETIQSLPRLLIIDSFSMLLYHYSYVTNKKIDENSSVDMTSVVEHYREYVKGSPSSILIVHHFAKYINQMRGSSALSATADGWWHQEPVDNGTKRLSWQLRDGPSGETGIRFRFSGNERLYLERATLDGKESASGRYVQQIKLHLVTNPDDWFVRSDFARVCGISEDNRNLRDAIETLLEDGCIVRSGRNGKGKSGFRSGKKIKDESLDREKLMHPGQAVGPEFF